MEASEVQNVCRLCPETGANQPLLNVFDQKFAEENNMKDVILVTTGIEVSETDLVSRKICQRCCNITLKMLQFRQDALKQDKSLKAKCKILLVQHGFDVPNGEVEVKDEPENEPTESETIANRNQIHPSIKQFYTKYPGLKLSKSLVQQNIAPIVSISAGEVEKHFKVRGLNMNSFIYKPVEKTTSDADKKFTEVRKTVLPIKISRNEKEKYTCSPILKRKLSLSGSESGPAKVSKEVPPEEESKNSSDNSGINDLKQISKLTTVKSKTLLECHVCRTFHSTSFALKIHLSKHKVCQFCKKTFKSLAAKDEHLKDSCEVKRILTSQPFVSLEPIHLSPAIRSKYSQSFNGFPSLTSEDTSDVVNVMVDLLDGDSENEQRNSVQPFEEFPSLPSKDTSDVGNVMVDLLVGDSGNEQRNLRISPNSVSIVKPDIDIKNSSLPCSISGLSDEQFLKQVIHWEKENVKARRTFTEKMIQTNLPSNLNIKINPTLGACEFKDLKDQLRVFKVPITISNGPFYVQYEFSKPTNKNQKAKSDKMQRQLDSLPVAYSRKIRGAVGNESNTVKASIPAKTITTTRPPTVLNGQISIPIQQPMAILPKPTPQTNSTCATPLLQSYVSSIPQPTPVLGFQDFQRKFLNTALQNRNGKQVVTTVSKAPPNIFNTRNIRLLNGISHFRMPAPPQNRTTTTTLNSAVILNRVPASSSGHTTTNSGMQMVRSIAPHGMTLNTRVVPVLYNTSRDQVKSPHQGVIVNNQSLNILRQNSTTITREASTPNQYPIAKKTMFHVVGKSNEVGQSVGDKSVQKTMVPSVAPTKNSKDNEKGVDTSVSYSHQPSSDVSIQSKPVFRVKSIRELQ